MRKSWLGVGGAALLLGGGLLACSGLGTAPDDRCDRLRNLPLDHAQITAAEPVSGGHKFSFMTALVGVFWFDLPPSCRVEGVIRPSADSQIGFAVWMPRENWTGRLQGIGNGGFAGAIDRMSLTVALQAGYAAAATDTGHVASDLDGSWALGHPEKVKDYGYRAIHETALAAKAIISAYYGHGPRYSYFGSGSNGGREALREAELYPGDYDGILAGCPAADGGMAMSSSIWSQKRLNASPASYIPADKLPAIAAAVNKACDAQDGIADGVIDDPRRCDFHPETMLCRDKEDDACLTAPQIDSLKAIYSGPAAEEKRDPGDGRHYRGYEPGGELGRLGWKQYLLGSGYRKSVLYNYALQFPRYLIYGDPAWDLDRFTDVDRFLRDDDHALGTVYTASPDLSRFAARGGKLVLYHGWSDPAIPPMLTVDFYERIRAHVGAEQTDRFARLYMVPGLQHGIGGPGTNVFGQVPPGGRADPGRNMSAALEAWVEQGRAPGAIVASRYDSNDFRALLAQPPQALVRTRPLCPYPQAARWSGQGSTDAAENFRCMEVR